jgi:hypothetical protein
MAAMSLEVDLFWSFRSPYSYLATPRLLALERQYELDVHVRPVLPIAVRIAGFFERVNPLWPPYLMRDTMPSPSQWPAPAAPDPDRTVGFHTTRTIPAEQLRPRLTCRRARAERGVRAVVSAKSPRIRRNAR